MTLAKDVAQLVSASDTLMTRFTMLVGVLYLLVASCRFIHTTWMTLVMWLSYPLCAIIMLPSIAIFIGLRTQQVLPTITLCHGVYYVCLLSVVVPFVLQVVQIVKYSLIVKAALTGSVEACFMIVVLCLVYKRYPLHHMYITVHVVCVILDSIFMLQMTAVCFTVFPPLVMHRIHHSIMFGDSYHSLKDMIPVIESIISIIIQIRKNLDDLRFDEDYTIIHTDVKTVDLEEDIVEVEILAEKEILPISHERLMVKFPFQTIDSLLGKVQCVLTSVHYVLMHVNNMSSLLDYVRRFFV